MDALEARGQRGGWHAPADLGLGYVSAMSRLSLGYLSAPLDLGLGARASQSELGAVDQPVPAQTL